MCDNLSLRNGRPNSNRRVTVESLDTTAKSKPDGHRPSESGSVRVHWFAAGPVGKDPQSARSGDGVRPRGRVPV
ncbi:hypothetical protein MPRF_47690 [Mycolicibacterium parafortuitum]|uniref:Uncharacterized protein n=1 Tax=Mycolicibacterium parafortuitum TaxID=39692 RepID=A0A7I7U9M3_MYCPF|nr:hypothetical protein MPRF_47690 [Mycolicibacterium parafortuitum]